MTTEENKDVYLGELYKAYDYATTEFDKTLMFISSGMLGVSFAFIEKIVPLDTAKNKVLLVDGWYMLGGAIFLSAFAHFVNILLLRWVIKEYNPTASDRGGILDVIIQVLNFGVLILILLGSYKIINFIQHNI